MATFPIGAICIWPGTNASIPSGWSRYTNGDTRYLQGVANDSRSTGGGSHTHTESSGHNHGGLQGSHTHTLQIPGTPATTEDALLPAKGGTPVPNSSHTHADSTSASATHTVNTATLTTSAATADPPYVEVIWITPNDGSQQLPDDVCVFGDTTTVTTDLNHCDGGGAPARPNYVDKYLKGAAAGGNAGATGGSTTHTHSPNSHTHTIATHSHANSDFGAGSATINVVNTGINASGVSNNNVHHRATAFTSEAITMNSANVTLNTGTSEPAYTYMHAFQNTNGGTIDLPTGIIVGYSGTLASIPSDWELCDGTGTTKNLTASQIKCTATGASVGTTGGSSNHTHTESGTHTHTNATHSHGITFTNINGAWNIDVDIATVAARDHAHAGWTVVAASTTNAAGGIGTLANADHRAAYRETIFIRKKAAGAATRVVSIGGPFSRSRIGYSG